MVEAEETDAELAGGRDALAQAVARRQVDHVALTEERGVLERDLARCRDEQASLRGSTSAADMEAFEDTRRRKGGQGVVKVADGACRGCGVSVPTSKIAALAEGDELIFCGHCERILCK